MLVIDLYRILEVHKGATEEQIRTQYKRLSLNFHPDKNIREHGYYYGKYYNILTSVYKVLTTQQLRQIYDVCGYKGIEEWMQNSRFLDDYMDFWRFYNKVGRQEQKNYRSRSNEDSGSKEVNDILKELYMKQKQKEEQEMEQQRREQQRRQQQQQYEQQKKREQEQQWEKQQQEQWDKDYYFEQEQEEEEENEEKESKEVKKKGRKRGEMKFDKSVNIEDISRSTKEFIEMQKRRQQKQRKQKKIEIDRKELQEKREVEYVDYIKEICRKCEGTNSKERRREYCECVKEEERCNKCQNGFRRLKKSEICEACTGGIAKNEQKIHVSLEKLIIK